MAADRKLIVTIVGDDASLQKALTRSTAATARFGKEADRNLRRGVSSGDAFAPLLARTREMKEQTADLSASLDATGAAAGRAGGSLFGLVGRASLVGLALNTAYQGSQQLQASLTTTGEEAFTTAGRLKNMAAALLSTDLIGGIKALTAVPKTLEDAGISATFAERHYEAFRRVAQGVGDINKATAQDLQDFDDAAQEAGTSSQKLAQEALALADANRLATATQDALNFSLRQTNILASGLQVALKTRREDLGGPLGPGGVELEKAQAALERQAKSGKLFTPLGPTAKNLARQVIAQAQGDLDELLRLQLIERDRLAKAYDNATGNLKQREALNAQLAAARAAVIGTQQAIEDNADAADRAADAARKAAQAEAKRRAAEAKRRAEELADLQRERRENAQLLKQRKQFLALGLTAAGGPLVPRVENLQRQLQQLTARADIGDLPRKLANQIARAGKVLSGEFGKVTEDTREAAAAIIAAARDELNQDITDKGFLTKTQSLNRNRILEGLGLSATTERTLRARLSGFNTAGRRIVAPAGTVGAYGMTFVVENHNTIELDGDTVARNTTRSQQKTRRSNPVQKRGHRSGI